MGSSSLTAIRLRVALTAFPVFGLKPFDLSIEELRVARQEDRDLVALRVGAYGVQSDQQTLRRLGHPLVESPVERLLDQSLGQAARTIGHPRG